jgi:hypothetical protein
MNPPIGAIKDRWIGGFGGKSKVSKVRMISACCKPNIRPASTFTENHLVDDAFDSAPMPTIAVVMNRIAKSPHN